MQVRKERAGASSHGYTWEHDGHVIEVQDEHVPELLAIRDAGFTVVEPAPAQDEDVTGDGGSGDVDPDAEDEVDTDGDGADEDSPPLFEPEPGVEAPVTEPAPATENPVTEAPAADTATKTRTPRKAKTEA